MPEEEKKVRWVFCFGKDEFFTVDNVDDKLDDNIYYQIKENRETIEVIDDEKNYYIIRNNIKIVTREKYVPKKQEVLPIASENTPEKFECVSD